MFRRGQMLCGCKVLAGAGGGGVRAPGKGFGMNSLLHIPFNRRSIAVQ